jgi:hypothetical protein
LKVDGEDLRRHYASLSDEALLEIDRTDLVEIAQQCYDEELARRGLTAGRPESDTEDGLQPDWLDDAACACTFDAYPGTDSASDAEQAREVLEAAGIPCVISHEPQDPPAEGGQPRSEYRVMVPGALNLLATSVLDKEIFNPELEADWKTHLEELSDEELRALDPDAICEGLLDRAERLKRVYHEKATRRGLAPPT